MAKKGNVVPCTKTPQNVREELGRKSFKEKAITSSINSTTNDNNESENKIEISKASNGKERNSGGKRTGAYVLQKSKFYNKEEKKEKLR